MSPSRAFGVGAKPRRSKYGVRTDALGTLARTRDSIVFASRAELRRYDELMLLVRAGVIPDLELQPRFPLRVASTTGTIMGAARALAGTFQDIIGEYRADFRYRDERDRSVTEDVKGFDVPLGRWKRRHAECQYGITIVVVRYR